MLRVLRPIYEFDNAISYNEYPLYTPRRLLYMISILILQLQSWFIQPHIFQVYPIHGVKWIIANIRLEQTIVLFVE